MAPALSRFFIDFIFIFKQHCNKLSSSLVFKTIEMDGTTRETGNLMAARVVVTSVYICSSVKIICPYIPDTVTSEN